MTVIGLSDEEQTQVLRMLSSVLWLGNISFIEEDDGNSEIQDTTVADFVAYLLGVDNTHLQKSLNSKVVETQRGGRRGSVYDVPLNASQSCAARDGLAKAIYNNVFDWIIARINLSMESSAEPAHLIGILVS